MYNIQNMFTNIFIKTSGFYRPSLPVILVLVLLLLPLFVKGYAQDDSSTSNISNSKEEGQRNTTVNNSIQITIPKGEQILKLTLLI